MNMFLAGGKMIDYRRNQPWNTTVSSVIVVGTYPLRMNQIRIAVKESQRALGRRTTIEEDLEFYEAIPESPDLRRVRVTVDENPYARIPLAQDLFRGPFDQRWGAEGEFIKRLYVGPEVARLEKDWGEK